MRNLKPQPYDITGEFVTSVTEIKVWDVVLDDDDTTAVPQLVSDTTITVASSDETASGVWTVVLTDESDTTVTLLAKTSVAPVVDSSTEDTDGDDRRWDCVLDDSTEVSIDGNLTEPVADSFAYYLAGTPANWVPSTTTWLSMTAAEYTKWM